MSDQRMANTTKAMLSICAFGLTSVIAFAVAPQAIDTTYQNQDNLIAITKLRNAGYLDDENGIELNINQEDLDNNIIYMASKQFEAAKNANDFLAKNRESLNNQSNH